MRIESVRPHEARPIAAPNRRGAVAVAGGLAVLLLAVSLVVWLAHDELRALGAENIFIDSHVLPEITAWQHDARPDALRVAVLGDSVLPCADARHLPPGSTPDDIGQRVGRALLERGVASQVLTAFHPAFRAIHFYYLLSRVIAGGPSFVVIEINPRSFSEEWVPASKTRFPNMSRELACRDAFRIRNELALEGVSQIDPVVYRVEERCQALWLADGLREGGRRVLRMAGDAMSERLGLAVGSQSPGRRNLRLGASLFRRQYGGDWAGHPMANVLRELLVRLRAAGVTPLFYVTPINVHRIEELGITQELAIDRRLAALQREVGATGAEWLDLHDLVPAELFRDWTEHLYFAGCQRVANAIAERLVSVHAAAEP